MPQYGYDAKRMKFDSTLQIPTFCGVPRLASAVGGKGAIAFDSCNGRFYYYNNTLNKWDTIKGGGGSTPSLQQVTDVGDSTTNPLYLDEIYTKNVYATVSNGDPPFVANYDINQDSRLITWYETNTGKSLVFYPTYPQNKNNFYYLPDSSGYITLSVNGNFADSVGNITLPSVTTPSLQDVTDVGDTTTNNIYIYDTSYNRIAVEISKESGGGYIGVNGYDDNNSITSINGSQELRCVRGIDYFHSVTFPVDKLGTFYNDFPLSNGVLALSINGNYADSAGNITLPSTRAVDTIYRINGKDSIFFTIGGTQYKIKDSIGGSSQNGRFGNDTATVVLAKVHNDAGSTLTNGEVVYLSSSGTSSDAPSVKRASNKSDNTSANTFGFVLGTISSNDTGYIIISGKIQKLNTAAYNNGDIIYLDSVAGKWTTTKPSAPYHLVYLGAIVKANAGNGAIQVKVQNGYELDEIHDVAIKFPQNNQVLAYSDTQKLWKNRNIYTIVDTTSLSNRINLKLNISDTATMLSPYLRKVDTASLSNRINLKLNISDTSTMLSPYLRKVDTASLSNRINLKLNISDTSTMLSAYLRKVDTASLSNRINAKQNQLNGTGFVKASGTTISYDNSTYLTSAVTSVGTGTGLSGGTITSTGTISADTNVLSTRAWRQKGIDSVQSNVNGKIGGSGTSGSIPKYTASTTLGNATVDVDYLQQDMSLVAMQAMGSSIKCYNIGAPQPTQLASAIGLTSQRATFTAVYIPKSFTITGVRWFQVTNGSYTANNYNGVGLYSVSGGTLTLVASSTNDGNIWQQGTNWQSKAFSSTYSASAGIYYICALYSSSAQTTAPSIAYNGSGSGTYNATSSFDFTNSQKTNGHLSSQTSLPATQALSGVGAASFQYGFYLY